MKKATRPQHQTNKITEELLTNCDTYLTRMRNRKVDKLRPEQQNQRDIPRNPVVQQVNVLRPLGKGDVREEKSAVETYAQVPTQKLLHKEAFSSNMATVEVTVRTAPDLAVKAAPKQEKSKVWNYSKVKQDTWSQLLLERKSQKSLPGSFALFDPLRTLHFLSKELQLKLQLICPDDPSVHQILTDMMHAVKRLPPDIISQFQSNELKRSSTLTELPVRDEPQPTEKLSKAVQVVVEGAVTEKLHKKLEESANKLEENCKQMEKGYLKLCQEKDDLLMQLQIEKENVKSLKKMLEERIPEREHSSKIEEEVEKLNAERKALRAQVKQLETQLKLQSNTQSAELRTLIQQLRDKQLMAEQESKSIKNELDVIKFEKEKLIVLLEYKDKELQELNASLENVQSLVSASLMELRSNTNFSTPSSLSVALSEILECPLNEVARDIKPVKDIMKKHRAVLKTVSSGFTGFTSVSEGEEDAKQVNDILQGLACSTPVQNTYEKTKSIKNAFQDLKRQALTHLKSIPNNLETDINV